MAFVYTRTLPNLTLATRRAAYENLASLCNHLIGLGTDLTSIAVDTNTRIVTVVLTNAIDADQRAHFGLD